MSVRVYLPGQRGARHLAAGTAQGGEAVAGSGGTFQHHCGSWRRPEGPQQDVGGKIIKDIIRYALRLVCSMLLERDQARTA